MAQTNRLRLNLLGVLSLLVGAAAIVQAMHPFVEYSPMLIAAAAAGVGVGVLGFLLSVTTRRFGSGLAVLGILVSLAAIGVVEYDNGTLPGWWAKVHPKPTPPQVVAPAVPPPVAMPGQAETHSNNIFGIPTGDPSTDDAGKHQVAPLNIPPASPAVMAPHPAPTIVQPTGPTLQEAKAKLSAATMALEKSLARDPVYSAAKADLADAAAKRDAALATDGAGSPAVQQASSQWIAAKTKLRNLFDAAAAKDPMTLAAQRDLKLAENKGQ
jgi:hypothetical protein